MESTKAIIFKHYKDVLQVGTFNLRPLKPKQILVKVYSASLNPIDVIRRDGGIKMLQKDEFPAGICFDAAGIVEQVGADVSRFTVGDRIVSRSRHAGTLAEFCIVDEDVSANLPENISFNDAAALPLAGQTALQALVRGGLAEGQTIFISGGAGGVGTYTIQLAKHVFKASRVVVTCSESKAGLCKSLGADEVIDYHKGNPYKTGAEKGAFDLVFDTVGEAAKMGGPLIKPGKFVISIASMPESGAFDRSGTPIPFFLRAILSVLSFRTKWSASPGVYNYVMLKPNQEDLTKLVGYMRDGTIRSVIDSTFDGLEKGPEAFKRLETGRAKGKVIVVVRS